MKILFICTGNTCRSSMAGALAGKYLEKRGLGEIEIMSAGTCTVSGRPASEHAVMAMEEIGINLQLHRTTALDKRLVEEAELVLTMTAGHRRDVLELCPEACEKVYTLAEYAGMKGDIVDPFGSGIETYRKVADQIEGLVALAVDRLLLGL